MLRECLPNKKLYPCIKSVDNPFADISEAALDKSFVSFVVI